MPRLIVYRNPTRSEWKHTPFLLDVQSDFIASLATRVVVPLRTRDTFPTPLDVLNPAFDIDGKTVIMDTAALAALPRAALRTEVADLRSRRLQIDNALDFLFQGI
ncbi:MAG: CcdB family protein [Burkholderiaceae bacterium]|nr:CcdB family protein [Burkholderiaceae bacterium]